MKLYVWLVEMSRARFFASAKARVDVTKRAVRLRSAFRAELLYESAHDDISHFRHALPLSGRSLCLKANLAPLGWLSTRLTFSTT
jgi:hypothetical protein